MKWILLLICIFLAGCSKTTKPDCDCNTDFLARRVLTTRTDTGEVIKDRALRDDEAQIEIEA
jgi:hypothetical protein